MTFIVIAMLTLIVGSIILELILPAGLKRVGQVSVFQLAGTDHNVVYVQYFVPALMPDMQPRVIDLHVFHAVERSNAMTLEIEAMDPAGGVTQVLAGFGF